MSARSLLPALGLLACGARVAPADPAEARVAPVDSAEARLERDRLVAHIAARHHVSPRVLGVLRQVPRHLFVDAPLAHAYHDGVLPLGYGQTISQPTIVALMSDALELDGHERVLEIGTGSGYQAAVLSLLAAHVDSIEVIPALADSARARLGALGYLNVDVRAGDGYAGWPERAPFDRIILTAAPRQIPRALYDQLAEGGILVGPVGEEGETQRLVRWRKLPAALVEEDLGPVVFVPMVPGHR